MLTGNGLTIKIFHEQAKDQLDHTWWHSGQLWWWLRNSSVCAWGAWDLHLISVLQDDRTLFSPYSPAAPSGSWDLAPPTHISNPGLGWNTHSLHLSCWLLRARVNFPPVGHRFCSICLGVFTLGLPLAETHNDVVFLLVFLNHRPHSICFESLILKQAWNQMDAGRKNH